MSLTVCLAPTRTLTYPDGAGGGHFWAYANWALAFEAVGCRVIWLECIAPEEAADVLDANVRRLKRRLAAIGTTADIALTTPTGTRLPGPSAGPCLDLAAATEADILINFLYGMSPGIVSRFRRSALVDIDPGLLQAWMATGKLHVAPHDVYFTIGERVGAPAGNSPYSPLPWQHTPPPVALEAWPVRSADAAAAYTTVSHWWEGSSWVTWGGTVYPNDKRTAFMEYVELPRRTSVPLELALFLTPAEDEERRSLERHGWRVRRAHDVSATPEQYRDYIGSSRGEFSCAKPGYVRFENAWISDRTLCYLASGKPAVVQHTGPSTFLPDAEGLCRFRSIEHAARCLELIETDYEHQCRAARALAEQWFDGRKVVRSVLAHALA